MTQQYAPQAPPPYGQPPYGGPGAPPPRGKALPWLIAALVLLLAVAGVLGFLLLKSNDKGSTAADQSAQADDQLGDVDGEAVEPPPGDEGAGPPEGEPYTDGGGVITGSEDRAAAFMDEVVLGQFENALGHGGTAFQEYYAGDAGLLEDEIITAAGGARPVNYTIDAVGYNADVDADVLSLTVEQPDGTIDDMIVLVGEEGSTTVVVGFE
jgi:hypothetical protein